MEIQKLKPEIKEAIKTDHFLQAELAAVNDITFWSLGQWRLKDNPMLTTATNLAIIRRRLNIDESVALTEGIEMPDKSSHKQPV